MAAISAAAVNELRKRTDLPMMECKSALVEADGDMEKADEILRVRFKIQAGKRSGNETGEGRIGMWFDPSHQKAAIIELRSESAPVANSEQFMTLARDLARHVAENPKATVEEILTQPFVDKPSITVTDRINETIGLLRENMKLARFQVLSGDGYYGGYVHHNGSVGALVKLSAKPEPEDLGRDVAMHIVAYQPTPIAVTQSEVPADVVAKEKSIAQQKAEATGKPAQIAERIAEGQMKSWFAENVLIEQPFVKDSSKTVGQVAKDRKVEVVAFVRFKVGETPA